MNNVNSLWDHEFKAIASLKWLPWVGIKYKDGLPVTNKLLVVAESHYEWAEDGARDWLEHPGFTRDFIAHNGLDHPEIVMNVLRNTERALFGETPSASQKVYFWNTVCYYNFIQRVLDSRTHRPGHADYATGWQTFFRVLEILQPQYCLFCGVGASDWIGFFNAALKEHNYVSSGLQRTARIGRTYARVATVKAQTGIESRLIFIKHPSSYFSWKAWAEFIHTQWPEFATMLSDET